MQRRCSKTRSNSDLIEHFTIRNWVIHPTYPGIPYGRCSRLQNQPFFFRALESVWSCKIKRISLPQFTQLFIQNGSILLFALLAYQGKDIIFLLYFNFASSCQIGAPRAVMIPLFATCDLVVCGCLNPFHMDSLFQKRLFCCQDWGSTKPFKRTNQHWRWSVTLV